MDWSQLDTPRKIARALWSFEALELAPITFWALFDQAYREADDVETVWQLGGAINDFLRDHPGAFAVPPQLPQRLLHADDIEARVIGLKLLNRIDISIAERIEEFIRAIERRDGYESAGGLHELRLFLEGCRDRGERIPVASADRLRRVLDGIPTDDDQDYRAWVAHLVWLVEEVRS